MNHPNRALDVFGCGLDGVNLIEASAGTGKTWNICGLYLRLLLERGLEAREILVVTFTNAATAELRERIRTRIAETLDCLRGRAPAGDPFVPRLLEAVQANCGRTRGEMAERLEAALGCFDEAAICTIHGFCQRALADTPLAAGLPYGLELIEDDAELRHEAVADFWRREVAGAQSDPDLAAWLAEKKDSPEKWARLLKRLQAKPLSLSIWPEGLDAPVQALRPALDAAFAAARGIWQRDRTGAVQTLAEGLPSLRGNSYDQPRLDRSALAWDAWLASGNPLQEDIDKKGKPELFAAGNLEHRKKSKKTPPQHAFFDAAQDLVSLRQRSLEQLARLRLRLLRCMAGEAGKQLRAKKRARRVVAFDDILYNAWDALCNGARPWLAGALRKRYPAALIDEFQDTDPLQCAIFMALYDAAGEGGARGPLFLVGDPKQAIYSFRNADLHTYLNAKARAQDHHTLAANQRSTGGLIEACNTLFAANPGGFILPGIAYRQVSLGDKSRPSFVDESEDGVCGAPLRLWRLPKKNGLYLQRDRAQGLSVQATAGEISRLLGEGQAGRIKLADRPLRAGDIAVLVRSHKQGGWIKQALALLGIGSVELSQQSIFVSRDAEDLEQVLAAILEPARQARLLAALATELMGASAAEIEAVSRDDAALTYWTARFGELRRTWLARGFGFMLRRWMDEAGVSRRLLARADGERRLTNLLHLGELLHRASTEHPAPDALARWLATQRAEAAAGEEAQVRLESDRNLVQIVTIHKAKGLEYGIVFCPFLWDGYQRTRGEPDAVEYHDEHGNGVIDFRPEASKDVALKRRRREESAAEDIRLAYVALTRAVQRCYLIAGCYLYRSGRGEPSPKQSTRSLLNWLAAGGGLQYAAWQRQKLATATIEQAWQGIADAAKHCIRLTDLPQARGAPLAVPAASPESLNALPPPEHIDPGWRIGSFTALAHGAEHESAASDHDARAVAPAERVAPEDLPAHDILRFPRGARAGDCVHAMFERADFTNASAWDDAIARALAIHPQRNASGAALKLQREMLRGLLEDVLAAQLPEGIVLGKLLANRRLNELGFSVPAAGLNPARLNAWLKANKYPMPRLTFEALQGYLKGYIDCVFEHGGRYYVLDWKSNHLGFAREDYAARSVAAAMQEHGYHLQYLLYSVAVHRYLRRRLANYDYEKHFGGALYLFVRGVRPGWRDAKGAPLGTWFHRPPAATLATLDALLGGQPKAIAA
ncbi:MAG: exodeoxyribonuclease V subunit beta [Betaproteobacteria bacterium RIFCSPLOWO2_12_FULL_67_28]|nr:MAG: exodeoxyribonuclease V subunit beta [Betaproteobacteria bacterium RIFCSPLOWO2_12_FULL_67_28]